MEIGAYEVNFWVFKEYSTGSLAYIIQKVRSCHYTMYVNRVTLLPIRLMSFQMVLVNMFALSGEKGDPALFCCGQTVLRTLTTTLSEGHRLKRVES